MAWPLYLWAHSRYDCLAKTGPVNIQSWMRKKLMGPDPFLLNSFPGRHKWTELHQALLAWGTEPPKTKDPGLQIVDWDLWNPEAKYTFLLLRWPSQVFNVTMTIDSSLEFRPCYFSFTLWSQASSSEPFVVSPAIQPSGSHPPPAPATADLSVTVN